MEIKFWNGDKMKEIIIDKEFSKIMPDLLEEEYSKLEQNIIRDGCREPLSLWENILLDGHNRYKICQKNNIKFDTIDIKSIESRDDAKIWIIENQIGKRNLQPFQRIELQVLIEPLIAERAKKNQATSGKGMHGGKPLLTNSLEAVSATQKEAAKRAHVGQGTYYQGKEIVTSPYATEEDKQALRKGEISI